MAAQNDLPDVKIDATSLYREEVYTDRRAGTIRKLQPVTISGADDNSRHVLFSGQTQLLTPAGVLPLAFELEVDTLEAAIEKFPEGVKNALEQAIDEAREMRREQASRIVVPKLAAARPAAVGRSSFPRTPSRSLLPGRSSDRKNV